MISTHLPIRASQVSVCVWLCYLPAAPSGQAWPLQADAPVAGGRRMELIIDLPVRFRRFEREDFIALFPRRLQRDAIALVLRLSIGLPDWIDDQIAR